MHMHRNSYLSASSGNSDTITVRQLQGSKDLHQKNTETYTDKYTDTDTDADTQTDQDHLLTSQVRSDMMMMISYHPPRTESS